MIINGTNVSGQLKPYLIAEIGVNHFDIAEQQEIVPLEAAKRMISAAAEAGADAVKFQSYSAESLASKNASAYWDTSEEETTSQYELFKTYDDFGSEEFETLADWTNENHGVDFLSTPFSERAVEYLNNLVPAYKIASADITNHPLLRSIAAREKPILLSTGASSISEIASAVEIIETELSSPDICLLHCVLEYPTAVENANLQMIQHLNDLYPGYTAGYSDHVPPDDGMLTLINAAVNGAEVIEKHFTLDKSLEGNDHYHAMDPQDIRTFRANMERLRTTTGQYRKKPIAVETDSRKYARRSLVAVTDIEQGELIEREQIGIKRPGTGIPPAMLDTILGRTATVNISADEILTWDMI